MKFTPEVLLGAPRRSSGIPNPAGDTVLHTVSTYSFETHKKGDVLRVLEVKSGAGLDVVKDKDVSGLNWIDDNTFVFLQSEKDSKDGATSLCVGRVPWDRNSPVDVAHKDIYVAGTIDAPASSLKIAKLNSKGSEFAVVFAAQASPDGSLFNSEKAKKTHSTGRLYTSLYVRHWDRYETKEKNALWYAKLKKDSDGKFQLSRLTNALKGSGLESPVLPFGGTDNFDICHNCIIFVAKDPDSNPALSTKSNVYIVHMGSWDEGPAPLLQRVIIPGYEGASTSPVVSPDGSKAAFLSMKTAGYESDRNDVFVLGLDAKNLEAKQILNTSSKQEESWDRSPSSLCFTENGKSLLAVTEDFGNAKLFMFDADLTAPSNVRVLTKNGSVGDVRCLSNGTIFVSGTTLVDNSVYAIVNPLLPPGKGGNSEDIVTWSNSISDHGNKLGLSYSQVSSIWTPASNKDILKEIHSWVIRPRDFDSSKKYPVAYLIHGGPQGSWADSWSTRWNPAVFAEQGYIVIAPNPTGSTGFGQEFTDSIRDNWGGDPYQDIVNCFEWVGKYMKEADNERAVALGASYGGYMMNWIQGHDLGRKFKALVCHDGILTTAGMLSTEELYFPFMDLGGTPWYDPFKSDDKNKAVAVAHRSFGSSTVSDWKKWDPSEHFENWATPQLVIHSSNDFRICMADGIGAFNVLQARGVESEFLMFPDENHFVAKPENSLAWHKTVLNWINKFVGLPPYTTQDPESEEYWGGAKEEKRAQADEPK